MDGSAAVIGEMLLPILEPPIARRLGHARDLGLAFQLTNFLRDVAEDLDRGRVYLPQEDLRRFGADPHRRVVDEPWRALMALRDRPVPRPVPLRRPGHRPAARRRRPAASGPPGSCTRGSSTASRPPATTCSRSGPGSRPGARSPPWPGGGRPAGDARARRRESPVSPAAVLTAGGLLAGAALLARVRTPAAGGPARSGPGVGGRPGPRRGRPLPDCSARCAALDPPAA